MTIKKMLLLASIALVAIAFAAPVAKAEPEWFVNGEKLEGEVEFTAEGEITSDAGVSIGPAHIQFEGVLRNESGLAGGEITSAAFGSGYIPIALPSCAVTGTFNNGSLPWQIAAQLTVGEPARHTLNIQFPTFETYFSEFVIPGCKFWPTAFFVVGTVAGTIEDGGSCIELNSHLDGLYLEDEKGNVTSTKFNLTSPNGPICLESEAGEITLE